MFKHLLVATDGSAPSMAAVDAAIGFANDLGARLAGLHVMPLRPFFSHVVGVLTAPEHEADAVEALGYLERRAAHAGVPVSLRTERGDHPHEAIIKTARDLGCDLIVMGSHGRGTAAALLLGSQTQAVLTNSAIPVLIVPRPDSSTA